MNYMTLAGTLDSGTGAIDLVITPESDFFGMIDGIIYIFAFFQLLILFWLIILTLKNK